ncbi:hypothetical protein J6590_020624 [Homalodisca vitripennis]|nr:hypothetical protein J6590_020624 [Homalodisca vitripennis]
MCRRNGGNLESECVTPSVAIYGYNIGGMAAAAIVWELLLHGHQLTEVTNRLESNAEHWNALLLSLRELFEWVIRKDTELTGLGPIGGDVASLQKQLVLSAAKTTASSRDYRDVMRIAACHRRRPVNMHY